MSALQNGQRNAHNADLGVALALTSALFLQCSEAFFCIYFCSAVLHLPICPFDGEPNVYLSRKNGAFWGVSVLIFQCLHRMTWVREEKKTTLSSLNRKKGQEFCVTRHHVSLLAVHAEALVPTRPGAERCLRRWLRNSSAKKVRCRPSRRPQTEDPPDWGGRDREGEGVGGRTWPAKYVFMSGVCHCVCMSGVFHRVCISGVCQ